MKRKGASKGCWKSGATSLTLAWLWDYLSCIESQNSFWVPVIVITCAAPDPRRDIRCPSPLSLEGWDYHSMAVLTTAMGSFLLPDRKAELLLSIYQRDFPGMKFSGLARVIPSNSTILYAAYVSLFAFLDFPKHELLTLPLLCNSVPTDNLWLFTSHWSLFEMTGYSALAIASIPTGPKRISGHPRGWNSHAC